MNLELVRCQRSGAAALSINACFLAPLRSPAEKEAGFTKASLWDTRAVCPSNSSCPLQLQLQNRTFNFFFFWWGCGRLCAGSGVGGWVEAFKY